MVVGEGQTKLLDGELTNAVKSKEGRIVRDIISCFSFEHIIYSEVCERAFCSVTGLNKSIIDIESELSDLILNF